MSKDSMFVGMDVHKNSIDIFVAQGGHDGEVRHFASIGGDLKSLDKAVDRLLESGKELHFVYEAGPCVFVIYRHLIGRGLECAVVCPAAVPKRANDRVKTDRRDARTLAVQHRAGALRAIYVPSPEDEAMRDLVRSREDAVHNRRRARQRINSFLLRYGRHFGGGKKWGKEHRRWLAEQYFDHPAQRITLEEYIASAEQCETRVKRLTEQIESLLETWQWKDVVAALQALRGVRMLVAVTVIAELGDLSRFTPPGLMAFTGMIPSEHTSGPKRRQGAITKTGNAHVRRVLTEAAHAYRGTPALTQFVRRRQSDLPKEIRDIGWRAQLRLCARFRHFSVLHKHPNKIRTAIARELLGFMWEIACRTRNIAIKPRAPRPEVITLRPRRSKKASA